jgi:spore coat polysaccharide biosynthesis protein SpsF
MTRIVASIEARMGSSRFPGKVLSQINGMPALARLVSRLRACRLLDDIVVASTTNSLDDRLEAWAKSENVAIYRGSEDDVLARVVEAHRMMRSDVIVEITGDAILTDPDVVDLAVRTFGSNTADVVSTSVVRSFPLGIDAQVFTAASLQWVAANISDPAVREHVSLHFYENMTRYRVLNLAAPHDSHRPDYRLVLDYPEDGRVFDLICRALDPTAGILAPTRDIVAFLDAHPEVRAINSGAFVKPIR